MIDRRSGNHYQKSVLDNEGTTGISFVVPPVGGVLAVGNFGGRSLSGGLADRPAFSIGLHGDGSIARLDQSPALPSGAALRLSPQIPPVPLMAFSNAIPSEFPGTARNRGSRSKTF